MPRIVVGLDFGTSSTSVSYADLDGDKTVKTVPLETSDDGKTTYNTMPSAMFYIPDQNRLLVGRKAISAYENREYEGRLLRNLKSVLDDVDATTKVSDTQTRSYRSFISNFLKVVKARLIATTGSNNIAGIVVGRPVHFFDDDEERDNKAEQNLREIVAKLGFENIVFLEEPIAASFSLETKIPTDTTALVADIGGGTSDFAAIALGPSHRNQTNRKQDVFATTGIKVGGTDFDKDFSLHNFMPELGFESKIKLDNNSTTDFPRKYFDTLSSAFSINELYNYTTIAELEHSYQASLERPRIGDLLHIIKTENGHRLITEVENCKKGLSYKPDFPFRRKTAFNLSDDLFMTKQDLTDAISKFNETTKNYLANNDAQKLLDEIKLKLADSRKQYGNAIKDYNMLFGWDETYPVPQCKKQLDNLIHASLEKWINKISSMSLKNIKEEFTQYKENINKANIDKITTDLNCFRENGNFEITFKPDFENGYKVFDNLLAIPLPEDEVIKILEPAKDIIIKNIITKEKKAKKLSNTIQKESTETAYNTLVHNFIVNIQKDMFFKCSTFDATNVLFQTIENLIHVIELATFNLPSFDELAKIATNKGAIYKDTSISKSDLEDSINKYMPRLQNAVTECIKKSGKDKSDFKYLIMTGGSSRIPLVRKSIQECFDKDIKVVCEDLSTQKDLSHEVMENIDTPDDISVGLCRYAMNVFK